MENINNILRYTSFSMYPEYCTIQQISLLINFVCKTATLIILNSLIFTGVLNWLAQLRLCVNVSPITFTLT